MNHIRSRRIPRRRPALGADAIKGPRWVGEPGFCFRAAPPHDQGAGQGSAASQRSMPQTGEECQAESGLEIHHTVIRGPISDLPRGDR